MDRVHIPRGKAFEPGTWCVLSGGELLHRCPQCKRAAEMLNHSVTPAGEVNASIGCFAPCGYHVWGVLDDWIYGEKRAGERVTSIEKVNALRGGIESLGAAITRRLERRS